MHIGHVYVFFAELSIQIHSFSTGFCHPSVELSKFLYSLEINPLSDVALVNMFSHTVGFLFILVSFVSTLVQIK